VKAAEIAALFLEGERDVVKIAMRLRCSVCYVRNIKRQMLASGALAGRNIG